MTATPEEVTRLRRLVGEADATREELMRRLKDVVTANRAGRVQIASLEKKVEEGSRHLQGATGAVRVAQERLAQESARGETLRAQLGRAQEKVMGLEQDVRHAEERERALRQVM